MGRRATVGGKERILEFVTAYTDEYGYSPTYREICDATRLQIEFYRAPLYRAVGAGRQAGLAQSQDANC